jgi:hypothetical protein
MGLQLGGVVSDHVARDIGGIVTSRGNGARLSGRRAVDGVKSGML